eukprot:12148270-Prorocentrum_lima.AAC.1
MKCSTCGSEYQLRRWCPKGLRARCTLNNNNVSGGLSEFPDAPRAGIIFAWLVSNVGQDPGEQSPEHP